MKKPTILITGSTGLLGKLLVRKLVSKNVNLILLVRSDSQKQAEQRVQEILDKYSPIAKIKILQADLNKQNLNLQQSDYKELTNSITHILHCAASTRFTHALEDARRFNVETTKNILNFANRCQDLERFGFVSTAFVAGKRKGLILENELEHDKGFLNTYEQTKYESELVVRQNLDKIPIVIFRPSLIISSQKKKSKSPFSALAFGLYLVAKGFLPILPGRPDNTLDVISGEKVADTIIKIFLKEKLRSNTYHITSGYLSPTIEDLIFIIESRKRKKLAIRFCGGIGNYNSEVKKITWLRPDLKLIYKKTESFLPELAFPKVFDNTNTQKELRKHFIQENPLERIKQLV